jgi:LysM repeat protein
VRLQVREGDTLGKIARRHRIKLPTLVAQNETLSSENLIRVGERLFL